MVAPQTVCNRLSPFSQLHVMQVDPCVDDAIIAATLHRRALRVRAPLQQCPVCSTSLTAFMATGPPLNIQAETLITRLTESDD